jgi:hypothetical protein
MTQNSSGNGRVTYRDCIDFQQNLLNRMDQMEARLMAEIKGVDSEQRTQSKKVYTISGIIAVLISLVIGLFQKLFLVE